MFRFAVLMLPFALAEPCAPDDAICHDNAANAQNSLLQHEIRQVHADSKLQKDNETAGKQKQNATVTKCVQGDTACCFNQGPTCTNPPNPFDPNSLCPLGMLCDADTNFNPFGTAQKGYCRCMEGGSCSADGKSCGMPAIGDPFLKCTGTPSDPPQCCQASKNLGCQNPPLNGVLCPFGQVCDADLGGVETGMCKCAAGTCSVDGKSCST
mmetsp:Transcript_133418/g.188482  ORF Transcript_133418/g.188482 Transcript_133418/m.188482 type:complete len:210 (+) Transcript_133418:78-707(+)